MKLALVNKYGDELSVIFAEDVDIKQCQSIRASNMPVSKALHYAQKRFDGLEGWFPKPAPHVALEGL